MSKENLLKEMEEINLKKKEVEKNLREIQDKEKEIEEALRQEDIKENEKRMEYLNKHKDIIAPLIEAHKNHVDGKKCSDSDYFDYEREHYVKCPRCLFLDLLEYNWNDVGIVFDVRFNKI